MKILAAIFSLWLFSFTLQAKTIANIEVPESITLPGSSKNLLLNGAGIRAKFIFDIYIGALYLEQKQTTSPAIYQLGGNKRIHMHFLYDEISKDKLTSSWSEGFENNHTEAQLKTLQPRIDQFNALFSSVKKGDVIDLNFTPGTGTSVVINNTVKGTVTGDDFFVALLKIWLGESPADGNLKKAMLGKTDD